MNAAEIVGDGYEPATMVTKWTGNMGNRLDAMAGGGGCRGERSVPWMSE